MPEIAPVSESVSKRVDGQREAATQFVVGARMGLLLWWLDNDVSYAAEKIHSIFRRLAAQDVRRVLAAT